MKLARLLVLASVAIFCFGCGPMHYLAQASAGQDEIVKNQIDIDEIIAHKNLSTRTRALLADVARIKAFGEENGLRATTNYTTWVDLHRKEVVWVTTACDPLKFRPKTWHFPFFGGFTYLGWFHEKDADEFAADLRAKGWDVDVRGSRAYSTVGWFKDPVLSTMIEPGDDARGELANTLLHESTHATFFVGGQSTLNESVASFVGDHLAIDYLRAHATPHELASYVGDEDSGAERAAYFVKAFLALESLYQEKIPDSQKLEKKAVILRDLREATHFKREINNATMIQFRTYGSGQPELARLLASCNNVWPRFLKALEKLRPEFKKQHDQEDPAKLLAPYVDRCD